MQQPETFLSESPAIEPVLPWFALKVRSNFEKTSTSILRENGYEEFAPSYPSRRYWSDRVKLIYQPAFPGYVFWRFNPNHWLPVLQTAGVVEIIRFGGKLVPIDDRELASLRILINSSLPLFPRSFLQVGRRVLIKRGPLAGAEGILEEIRKGFRIVVSISMLQRSVTAEIDANWVTSVQ